MSDLSPQFGQDNSRDIGDEIHAQAADLFESELQSQLNMRGQILRSRSGMIERVLRVTPSVIPLASEPHRTIGFGEQRRMLSQRKLHIRWRVGFAVAATIAVTFVLANIPTKQRGIDSSTDLVSSPELVFSTDLSTDLSTDQGGTAAEPVLVSLLAGSEIISDDGTNEFVIDEASAMTILRTRDASFGDLNSEVQLILASAFTQ